MQEQRRRAAYLFLLLYKKQSYVQDSAKSESSNRTIPLTPKAISLLQMLAANAENEWVFVNDDGQRLSYEALRYQTQCLCKASGVPYRGEHVFRHTFATNCYHKGVDVKILSRLLGYADVNITYNIYVHLYGDGFDEMYSEEKGTWIFGISIMRLRPRASIVEMAACVATLPTVLIIVFFATVSTIFPNRAMHNTSFANWWSSVHHTIIIHRACVLRKQEV